MRKEERRQETGRKNKLINAPTHLIFSHGRGITSQEYLVAGPEDKEVFHDQGIRRLNNEQVAMPSGRILADSNRVSHGYLIE